MTPPNITLPPTQYKPHPIYYPYPHSMTPTQYYPYPPHSITAPNITPTHPPQHDTRADPPDPDGVYIMDAFSSDGSQPNNNKFSLNSRTEMLAAIRERGQSKCITLIFGGYCASNLWGPC